MARKIEERVQDTARPHGAARLQGATYFEAMKKGILIFTVIAFGFLAICFMRKERQYRRYEYNIEKIESNEMEFGARLLSTCTHNEQVTTCSKPYELHLWVKSETHIKEISVLNFELLDNQSPVAIPQKEPICEYGALKTQCFFTWDGVNVSAKKCKNQIRLYNRI
ncbi:MAG: hypothetical protein JXR76_10145 [Deltaproteobacteria bacterium]|nr:hypothetical protein [Deltaproteobacteria bacterium]